VKGKYLGLRPIKLVSTFPGHLIGARWRGLWLCRSVFRPPSRAPSSDSNSTTNVPTTVNPPARESCKVISLCGGELAVDALGRSKWLCAVLTFPCSHPLGCCIFCNQRRLLAHMVGVVHFRTQKGTHGRQKRGIIIVAIGAQNGMKCERINGANTALFGTGRSHLMLWESRGYF
jgi:hypothetical protein